MYIITARRPAKLTIEQLYASLDNAQSVLSSFFPRGSPGEFTTENGIPLARGGNIFASDYQKAAALSEIVMENASSLNEKQKLDIYFFDDAIVNAYVVGTTLNQHLAEPLHERVRLTSCWWDPFEEETGLNQTMTPSHTDTTDSNHADFTPHMLEAYGITKEQRDERVKVYRSLTAGKVRKHRVAGEKIDGVELKRVEAAGKSIRTKMAPLEGVLGARFAAGSRPPQPPQEQVTKKEAAWKAKARAERDRAAAAKALFRNRPVMSLPPGKKLDAPRWETAFQVDSPAEGSTGGLFFVATYAGGFAIKSGMNPSEEFYANKLLRALGVPVPDMRLVLAGEEEYDAILKGVRNVGTEYSRRGDAEGAGYIMVHVWWGMKRSKTGVLVMELLSNAITLSRMCSKEEAIRYLEPEGGDQYASSRLRALGRMWVADAVLNFRDRFASRINLKNYGQKMVSSSNLDNVILTKNGIFAIDSHVKLIKGPGAVSTDLMRQELGSLASSEPIKSLDWLRLTVESVSGHVLSDSALSIAREGALSCLSLVSDAASKVGKEILAAVAEGGAGRDAWRADVARIDVDAMQISAEIAAEFAQHNNDGGEVAAGEGSEMAGAAEIAAEFAQHNNDGGEVAAGEGSEMARVELRKDDLGPVATPTSDCGDSIGAEHELWMALSETLRQALQDERLKGISPGPHSAADFFPEDMK